MGAPLPNSRRSGTDCCPQKTAQALEHNVVRLRHQTGYGRARLSQKLWQQERIALSAHTIRHILRRHGLVKRGRQRKVCYPAHWAWQTQKPFAL